MQGMRVEVCYSIKKYLTTKRELRRPSPGLEGPIGCLLSFLTLDLIFSDLNLPLTLSI